MLSPFDRRPNETKKVQQNVPNEEKNVGELLRKNLKKLYPTDVSESKGDITRRAAEAEKEHELLTCTIGGLTSTTRHEPLQPSPV